MKKVYRRMTDSTENIKAGRDIYLESKEEWLDNISAVSPDDQILFEEIGNTLSAMFDIEEVRNDPDYGYANNLAVETIKEYKAQPLWSRDNAKFVTEAFEEAEQERVLREAIREIRKEIKEKNMDNVALSWVKEWNDKKEKSGESDIKTKERRDFITGAIQEEVSEPKPIYQLQKKRPVARIIRLSGISAAAVIGLLVTLRILQSPVSADKLFSSYYQPLTTVSPVTRGVGSNYSDSYTSGIQKYRSGDYEGAALMFNEAINTGNTAVQPRFFLGITYMALGNYSSAIDLLDDIAGAGAEFGKEARWYLGLAYLKTGEKEKAIECFKPLADSPGYFRDKAGKILRRLK